jgi:hypothetical protein
MEWRGPSDRFLSTCKYIFMLLKEWGISWVPERELAFCEGLWSVVVLIIMQYPKDSNDGIYHSELLGFWTLSIVRNSKYLKTQRFGNWICFRPQMAWEKTELELDRSSFLRCCVYLDLEMWKMDKAQKPWRPVISVTLFFLSSVSFWKFVIVLSAVIWMKWDASFQIV